MYRVSAVASLGLALVFGLLDSPARLGISLVGAIGYFVFGIYYRTSPDFSRKALVVLAYTHVALMQFTTPESPFWVLLVFLSTFAFQVLLPSERRWGLGVSFAGAVVAIIGASGALRTLGNSIGDPALPVWFDVALVGFLALVAPAVRLGMAWRVTAAQQQERLALQSLEQELESRRRLQAELEEARTAALAASDAKSAFLANMSHEIRNPIGAIIRLASLAKEEPSAETRDQHLDLVERSAQHLLDILNDVLDFSKIEAGRMSLEFTPADLSSIVSEVAALGSVRASAKGLHFNVHVQLQGPPGRLVDALRLKQVLHNLVGNALKFTEHGGVRIEVTEDEHRVHFSVKDTGVGMSEEELQRVGQPFQQGNRKTSHRFGGTGLGLSITQQILALWDSELTISSTLGVGTTASFGLALEPIALVSADLEPQEDIPTFHGGIRVLVAEDNPINQVVLSKLLGSLGVTVVVVSHGRGAVEAASDDVDLILMDIQMPDMDGITATETIRLDEGARGLPAVPIVALTAHAHATEREACLAAGMQELLTKPVDRLTLARTLQTWVVEPRQAKGGRAGQRA